MTGTQGVPTIFAGIRFYEDIQTLQRYGCEKQADCGFLLIVLPIVATSGMISIWMFKKAVQKNIESELSNTSTAISDMVRTTAVASIKNYLCAVAEKNLEIVRSLYAQYEEGEVPKETALRQIRKVLLSQRIGKTGYIYCIDSNGVATVHPRKQVQDRAHFDFKFIRDQIKLKNGYMEYEWKNPEDRLARPKALYMSYFEPLDWIISVSTYREEFSELVNVDDFKSSIRSLKFGASGYAFVFSGDGRIIIHPLSYRMGKAASTGPGRECTGELDRQPRRLHRNG